MTPTVGYWNIRGLCEPIRYLLAYTGVDYEDKRYQSRDEWMLDKYDLLLDFPNLPYYIDGDVRLTQSLVILRYLAKIHNLAAKTEEETMRIELAEQQLIDFRTNLAMLAYNPNYKQLKHEFTQSVPPQLKLWSTFLGTNKFLVGDNITYIDFIAYDVFDFYKLFLGSKFKKFANLQAYVDRFESLPQLQAHFKSPNYKRWPIFSSLAIFGGSGEEPRKDCNAENITSTT